jgi:hypothetical protein
MRKLSEIKGAEAELLDRVRYIKAQAYIHLITYHGEAMPPEDEYDQLVADCKRLEAKYGADALMTEDDFEDGLLAGRLSAICWVLGSGWEESLER